MSKSVTAKPGRYHVSATPFQKEPQESFVDPEVQTTVLYWAKRLGKTEMINNLHGSTIEQNPRNILVAYPTLDGGKKWSKQFFTPMVRSTKSLNNLIKPARQKDANNTILSKEYPGGTISAIGANSPSAFRQVQAPVVTCDEIDAMEDGPEGDPVFLAFGRAENYPDSVQVCASTATKIFNAPAKDGVHAGEINTGSRIHNWWLKSDQRKWFCPCPKCGYFQVLMWSQLKWTKPHLHEEAWYECENPHCGSHWDDRLRVESVMSGVWRPTAFFRGIRGYWLNGIVSTFAPKKGYKTKMHQMAAEFYDAFTSGEAARIYWKNTFLCEPHEEAAERIAAAPLLQRCETYTPDSVSEAAVVVCAVVDVQGDRLEIEFVGMGADDETWGMGYHKIFGDTERNEAWTDLRNLLTKTFKRVDGAELKLTCAAIDLAHKPKKVRKFIRECGLPRVYGVYGTPGKQVVLVSPKYNKKYRSFSYSVNTQGAKDLIFARLKSKTPGPGYMHFPVGHGYDADYFDMLTAEEAKVRYSHGFPERYYEKIRDRNEALDLRVYHLAAMDILRPVVKQISASLLAGKPQSVPKDYVLKDGETAPPAPAKPKVRQRRRMSLGGASGFGWGK